MKLISWNVNGLRACLTKGFIDAMVGLSADIICTQETKMEEGQAVVDLPGYEQYWNSAKKKGYSGTAIFTKLKPNRVSFGMGDPAHDEEGRMITLFFDSFTLVNVYTPNSKPELARLDYRMEWEDAFRTYLTRLDKENPVIVCGDLNVAHQEIDLKNPSSNRKNPGFTDEEREKMTQLLKAGFKDTFRFLYPEERDAYSWWSYRFQARAKNIGWRIDYFLASARLMDTVTGAAIHPDISGSDHCPVSLELHV